MADSARDTIYQAIASIRLIDPHTHINPHRPASSTLADLLGYHYYTELAHSAGMAKEAIEEPGIEPRELVGRLVHNLSPIENTAQYSWLVAICRMFFDFDGDRIDSSNWEAVYESAESRMESADWPQTVLDQSNVEAVFLTNDFDDSLSGFDTETYIPCLRTDDLVFHLAKLPTQQRLAACSGIELDGSLSTLRQALRQRFEHFVSNGARACAISLPPSFEPKPVTDGRAQTALDSVLRKGPLADATHQAALSRRVFWTLAELCDEFGIPFDLMIGVNRGVYAGGVYQGQDLYDSRVSLIQYRELFNAFPSVKFPISVLASVTNQELVSYAWIFPNVVTNGHWWYSNTPSFISRDAAARLEAVPRTKQIAYYSDAYKLEFVWPKFDMYRRVLAGILADHFVSQNGWSEERAIELGQQVLRDNVDAIFPKPEKPSVASESDGAQPAWQEDQPAWQEDQPAWQEDQLGTLETAESISGERLEPDLPSDPLPSEDEIDAVEIADVELRAQGLETVGMDRESIEQQIEDEPIEVDDLFGEEDESTPSIRMLRGEQSFSTDEESLRLRPDPVTGELIFNPANSEDAESDDAKDIDEPGGGENLDPSESEDDRR